MHASRLLLDMDPDEGDEELGLPAACPEVAPREAIFEAAKRNETCDDNDTTPPSLSEDSCGDVFDDGWEKDLEDDYWTEIHLARTADFFYSKSSTGQSLDEWLETLEGLRQAQSEFSSWSTFSLANAVRATWRSGSANLERQPVSRCTLLRRILQNTLRGTLLLLASVIG